METAPKFFTIQELVELRKHEIARANPEYQRGITWTRGQQKKLVDSVMRDYQLPLILLHYNETTVAGLTRQSYEVIDGQQRIEALYLFVEGAFPLYQIDDERAGFPKFMQNDPCPWGGKYFHSLSNDLQDKLLNTKIPVAVIKADNNNEVRDMFVRLMPNLTLNAQEKRDSYPGQFTDFILSLGGKPEIAKYPGHPFFQRVLGMKPDRDRGKTRLLAAQIASLFLERRKIGPDHYVDIDTNTIDKYYYDNLDFDSNSDDCKRLRAILDKLTELFDQWDYSDPKLRTHDAIHLVLLLDTLWDDDSKWWESTLVDAQKEFLDILKDATPSSRQVKPIETWSWFGIWTRSNPERGENIKRRHRYYSLRMKLLMRKKLLEKWTEVQEIGEHQELIRSKFTLPEIPRELKWFQERTDLSKQLPETSDLLEGEKRLSARRWAIRSRDPNATESQTASVSVK